MPGVPSGKGCDGCRKQKKKCDQGRPACSRCARLKIPCIGAGQQRYSFKPPLLPPSSSVRVKTKTMDAQATSQCNIGLNICPFSPLSSPTSLTANRLASLLSCQDLRFDITIFGFFWSKLPRRLGNNDALDTAVHAFSRAVPNLYSAEPRASEDSMAAFGGAMVSVRKAMGDSKQAYTGDVLCAVFLLLITHNMINANDPQTLHAQAMAHLLPHVISRGIRDDFDAEIVAYVTSTLIYASMYTPTLQLSVLPSPLPSFTAARPFRSTPPNPIRVLSMASLSRLPLFTRAPSQHIPEIVAAYGQICEDLPAVRARIAVCDLEAELEYTKLFGEARREKMLAQWQVAYSLVLTIALFLNSTLLALNLAPSLPWPLLHERTSLISEILALARSMTHLRPLFSTGILNPLFLAWAVESDEGRLADLEDVLAVYLADRRMDERREELYSGGVWFREHFRRLRVKTFTLREQGDGGGDGAESSLQEAEQPMPMVGNCTIL